MRKVLITILLLSLFVVKQAFASFSLLDLASLNGQLSNNAILCIHQDLYGFMWFGTYDGLKLYDGKKVTTFRYEINNPNSLSVIPSIIYKVLMMVICGYRLNADLINFL